MLGGPPSPAARTLAKVRRSAHARCERRIPYDEHSDHGSAPHPRRINRITPQMGRHSPWSEWPGWSSPPARARPAPHASSAAPPPARRPRAPRAAAAAVATCPLTGTPVPGGGAGPATACPGREDRQLPGGPAAERDGQGRRRVRRAGRRAGSPAMPPSSSARTRRWSGPSARPATSTSASSASWARPCWFTSGGIDPVLANIAASPLVNVDLGNYGSLQTHPSGRVAPYSTYSTTAQLWATHPSLTTPPQPLFTYSSASADGEPGLQRGHRFLRYLRRHVEVQPRHDGLPALLQRHHP